jgi:hypothetical protein
LQISILDFYDGIEGAAHNAVLELSPEELVMIKKYSALPEPQKKTLFDYVRFLETQV